MSCNISRETYVHATEADRVGMTYDLLTAIENNSAELKRLYYAHLGVCNLRFEKIEHNEKRMNMIAALIGGGIVTAFSWVRNILGKLL